VDKIETFVNDNLICFLNEIKEIDRKIEIINFIREIDETFGVNKLMEVEELISRKKYLERDFNDLLRIVKTA
jgi:hypothetical protein